MVWISHQCLVYWIRADGMDAGKKGFGGAAKLVWGEHRVPGVE